MKNLSLRLTSLTRMFNCSLVLVIVLSVCSLPLASFADSDGPRMQKEPPKQIPLFPHYTNRSSASGFRVEGLTERWKPIGPAPSTYANYGHVSGRVTSIAVAPNDPNTVYAAAAGGGLWKSTDGGTSWSSLADDLPSLSAGAVATDPSNPNVVYYGTGEANFSSDGYSGAGVYRSTDGGQTWTQLSIASVRYTSQIVVAPSNPQTVYVCGYRGLWSSTDGGNSWTDSSFTAGAVNSIAVDPNNAKIIYAGKGSLWGTDNDYGLFKSTDGGGTWTKLTNGLPASTYCGRVVVALARSAPDTVYVGIWGNFPGSMSSGECEIFKSTDGGTSWTQMVLAPNYGGEQGWFDNVIAVDPSDPNVVFAGGIDVWESEDGGTSWNDLTNGYFGGVVHVDQHAIAFAPSDSDVIYFGNDGGVWKSTDGASTFINCNTNLAITQFYRIAVDPQSPGVTYGGTQDNGTLRNVQPSLTWNLIYGGDGGTVIVDPTDSSTIYAEYVYGALEKSTDYGTVWTGIKPVTSGQAAWIAPFVMSPVNHEVLYTAADKVYRTGNGGESWTAISPVFDTSTAVVTALAVSPVDTNVIWTAGSAGIYVTTDAGASWKFSKNQAFGYAYENTNNICADPRHSNTAYLLGTGVQRTTDYGSSWQQIATSSNGLPSGFPDQTNVIFVDSLTGYIYLGTEAGVYRSTDNGGSWSAFNQGLPNVMVDDITMQYPTHSLRIATHGRSVFAYTLSNLPPVCRSSNLQTIARLETVNLKVSGSSFYPSLTQVDAGNGISVNRVTVSGDTLMTVNMTVSAIAATGEHDLVVSNPPPGGGTDTLKSAFSVVNPSPRLYAVSPNVVDVLDTSADTLKGANFISGVTSVLVAPGVLVTSTNVMNPSTMVARFTAPDTTKPGARDIAVFNEGPGGGADTLHSGLNVHTLTIALVQSGAVPFGEVAVGDTSSRPVLLENRSPNPVIISMLSTETKSYGTGASLPLSIQGKDSARINVEFMPGSFGVFLDSLHITATDDDLVVPLSGSSPYPAAYAKVSQLNFGSVPTGTSSAQNIAVRDSSINPLRIDTVFTRSKEFAAVWKQGSITSKDSLVIKTVFSPIVPGTFRDTLFVHNDSHVSLLEIPLSGNSPSPLIAFVALPSQFSAKAGQSQSQSVKIVNRSISPLTIDSATTLTTFFIPSRTGFPDTVGQSDTASIAVKFTPDSAGNYLDTLSIFTNENTYPNVVPLSGTGKTPTGIMRDGSDVPRVYQLYQNYPNPFNPSTTIKFALPEQSQVSVTIYDILGREIRQLVNDRLEAGYYHFVWDAGRFASGVYFYRIVARSLNGDKKSFVRVKKLMLMK